MQTLASLGNDCGFYSKESDHLVLALSKQSLVVTLLWLVDRTQGSRCSFFSLLSIAFIYKLVINLLCRVRLLSQSTHYTT